jgi:hypothetical protein
MNLDPRSRDYAIRTIFGEAFNDPSEEAVAHVIRNRTIAGRYGGKDVPSVVLARNQFEPWNDPKARARMQGLSPDSPEYQRLGAMADRVWSGEVPDPTNGATHFFAPKAQAALGRDAPKWGRDGGQQIGAHTFFAPEGRVAREGDVEGPPMALGFTGVQREMNPMNYALQQRRPAAPQQAPQDPGALSAQGMMGDGALSENWGGLIRPGGDTDFGNALERAGLYLRDGTSALGALSALKKTKAAKDDYTISQDADGNITRMHKPTGTLSFSRNPNIEPGAAARKSYDQDDAKAWSTKNQEYSKAAATARSQIATVDRMEQLFSDPNLSTGAGAELLLEGKKWLKTTTGVDLGGVESGEAIRAISNQLALTLRNTGEGQGMPGALSDADRKFLQQAAPGITNTPEGNKLLIDYSRRIAQRNLEVDKMRRDYLDRNGRLDKGFEEELNRYVESAPLFSTPQGAPAAPGSRPPLSSFSR